MRNAAYVRFITIDNSLFVSQSKITNPKEHITTEAVLMQLVP